MKILAILISALMLCACGIKFDSFELSTGESRAKKNDVWIQEATGYEAVKNHDANAYMLGAHGKAKIGKMEVPVRVAYKNYGMASLAALWGDPDNPVCHTCSPTTSSYQTQRAESIGFALQPTWKMTDKLSLFLTGGVELGSVTWQAHFFHAVDANQQSRVYSGSADIHHTGIFGTAGIGMQYGNFIVNFEYSTICAEGKGSKWGGAGAFDGQTMLTFGIKF